MDVGSLADRMLAVVGGILHYHDQHRGQRELVFQVEAGHVSGVLP